MSSGSKDYGRNYRKSTANSNKNKNVFYVNYRNLIQELENLQLRFKTMYFQCVKFKNWSIFKI